MTGASFQAVFARLVSSRWAENFDNFNPTGLLEPRREYLANFATKVNQSNQGREREREREGQIFFAPNKTQTFGEFEKAPRCGERKQSQEESDNVTVSDEGNLQGIEQHDALRNVWK